MTAPYRSPIEIRVEIALDDVHTHARARRQLAASSEADQLDSIDGVAELGGRHRHLPATGPEFEDAASAPVVKADQRSL